jgi:hypothetical protein
MRPSNDHEVAIADIIDGFSLEGRLQLSIIPEVAAALEFMMSRTDSEFLVRYIQWRMANPLKPPLKP